MRPAARRTLAALPRDALARIAAAIESLATQPRPPGVTKLRGPELLVLVVRVGHRREVYR